VLHLPVPKVDTVDLCWIFCPWGILGGRCHHAHVNTVELRLGEEPLYTCHCMPYTLYPVTYNGSAICVAITSVDVTTLARLCVVTRSMTNLRQLCSPHALCSAHHAPLAKFACLSSAHRSQLFSCQKSQHTTQTSSISGDNKTGQTKT
jgi:hypothetical protein